jgi:hypothetical protein
MLKTTALVGAALMTFTASGVSMHHAGWFHARSTRNSESRQVRNVEAFHSEAALRYRHNQNLNWRQVMAIR